MNNHSVMMKAIDLTQWRKMCVHWQNRYGFSSTLIRTAVLPQVHRSQRCVQKKDSYKEFWPRSYYSGFENWRWAKRGHAYQSRIHCTPFFIYLFNQWGLMKFSLCTEIKIKITWLLVEHLFLWAFSFVRLKKNKQLQTCITHWVPVLTWHISKMC